jgi:ribosomal protein S18 acetylase RimI-like enzyme
MEFLERVYGSTRAEELALTEWDDATKSAFIAQQFRAQHEHYTSNYVGATYDVVVVDGEDAGRLYVARWPDEIRMMDIALLPEYRGRGVGTPLIRALMREAADGGMKLSIHVEQNNRALGLYRRLGFEPVHEHGVYVLLEWRSDREGSAG